MKYYAVTNDPTELMHYGIKGMKWGVIRTDAQLGHPKKPRSAAYKKASSKLGKMMKSGIEKAKANWKEYNSPENKQIRADKRYMRRTDKYLQQARKGKLKYKKLDDWQVQRITDRLNAERVARSLSNTEKGKIKKILGAMGEGALQGITRGVATSVGERFSRGSVLKTDRLRERQKTDLALERERKLDDYANSRSKLKRDAENAVRKEYYEEAARKGELFNTNYTSSNKHAKRLEGWNKQKEEEEAKKHYDRLYKDTYYKQQATSRARSEFEQKKLNAGNKKENKNKNKNKNDNKSIDTKPINININTYDPKRISSSASKEAERSRRLNNNRAHYSTAEDYARNHPSLTDDQYYRMHRAYYERTQKHNFKRNRKGRS